MKKKKPIFNRKSIIALAVAMMTVSISSAQLKLYSTGSISMGSLTPPPANTELQVIGNSVFSNNTGPIISSAYIRGLNGFSRDTMPEFSWWGDTKTGMFHPALNNIAFAGGGTEAMRITSGNNLVIGSTTDNGDRLQVNSLLNKNGFDIISNTTAHSVYSGINWVTDTTTIAWAVKCNNTDNFYVLGSGQAYGHGWNTLSDSAWKENIRPIGDALGKVLRLNGVTYNYKNFIGSSVDGQKHLAHSSRQMGLIAQQVERVAPEVVSRTEEGARTVAYGNLIGLLVEALKQEDQKVDKLKQQLDSCILSNKVLLQMVSKLNQKN